jgi:hypothetical protein
MVIVTDYWELDQITKAEQTLKWNEANFIFFALCNIKNADDNSTQVKLMLFQEPV